MRPRGDIHAEPQFPPQEMGEGGNYTLKRVLGKLHEKKKTVCGDAQPPSQRHNLWFPRQLGALFPLPLVAVWLPRRHQDNYNSLH